MSLPYMAFVVELADPRITLLMPLCSHTNNIQNISLTFFNKFLNFSDQLKNIGNFENDYQKENYTSEIAKNHKKCIGRLAKGFCFEQ